MNGTAILLTKTNLPISLSCFTLSYMWSVSLGVENPLSLSVFTGGCCLFLYNLHRLFKYRNQPFKRAQDVIWNTIHMFFCLIALTILMGAFYRKPFPLANTWLLSPVLFTSFFYVFPDGRSGLRKVPFLKAPLVAFSWVYFVHVFPLFSLEKTDHTQWMEATSWLLFYVAIIVPFDVRDQSSDDIRLSTLPQWLGNRMAVWFSVAMAISFVFVQLICNIQSFTWYGVASLILLIGSVSIASPNRSGLYYIWLDLLPLLMGCTLLHNFK
jgi:hypothetical protein